MILITGGMGFIGMHVARRVLQAGEDVVLTQHQARREPDFLKPEGGPRAIIERADITSSFDVFDIVRRYPVACIVHLVAPPVRGLSAAEEYRVNTVGLINVL